MDARQALIQVLFPLFYEVKPGISRAKARSSYGMKHDFEDAFRYGNPGFPFYFGNAETIRALVALRVPHYAGHPNYLFQIKNRFPMNWIRNRPPPSRPKYVMKKHWQAFLDARTAIDELVKELGVNSYMSLDDLIGWADVGGVTEIPLPLARRLADVDYTPQQINQIMSEAQHAWEEE